MKKVQQALTPDGGGASITLPPGTCFLEKRENVNLNNLIAGAVKQAAQTAGGVILRMDELPQINAYAKQLEQAFNLLLCFIVKHIAPCGKMYCYVKGAPAGPSLLDEQNSTAVYSIEIHTNVHADETNAAQQLLQQAAGLFAQNKIGLEYKGIAAGGMLFSLTLMAMLHSTEMSPAHKFICDNLYGRTTYTHPDH